MRLDTLATHNLQTQGARRRAWLLQHSPEHIEQCSKIVMHALQQRPQSTSQSTLVLGAGACTEIPLADLVRASDELMLADFDLTALQRGRDELASPALRKRVQLVHADISAGVSMQLQRLVLRQHWNALVAQGARAVFDAAADCLEACPVPDPPELEEIPAGNFGLVISALVLSQLFSYPILDLLDHVQRIAPEFLVEQERHHRYQEATQAFRTRVITAHLHYLRSLLDSDGLIVLLCDIRGFAFTVHGSDHDEQHRRSMPLVPRTFPDLVHANFTVLQEAGWDWLTDLPEKDRPGRGYEVAGYVLS